MSEGLLLAALGLFLANVPFVFSRRVLLVPRKRPKTLALRIAELAVGYVLLMLLANWLEARRFGSAFDQGWAFYVVTVSLFLVAAFPGFVARYLWHPPRRAT